MWIFNYDKFCADVRDSSRWFVRSYINIRLRMLVYIKSKKQGNSEHCLDSCVKLIMRWFMYKVHG
jgi:hypothetical protein